MRGRFAALLVVAATLEPAGAIAMKPPSTVTMGHCTVIGEENLPAALGGARALCAVLDRTIAAHAGQISYTAQVKVLPRSRLSAVVVVNGRELPEQNFAVMDRELSSSTLQRFADSLAEQVSEAAHGPQSRG
jgi:hypothetical protein